MFLSKTPIAIPAKTLIEDLISRSGSPNKESLSPYNGSYNRALDDIVGHGYEGSVQALFRAQPDYDADKQKPYLGEKDEEEDNNMMNEFHEYVVEGEEEAEYPRRLEDIDVSHVIHYLNNILYGVKYNAGNSIRSYKRDNPTTMVLTGSDDEVVEEKDMLIDNDTDIYSSYEVHEAKCKVPYLIRRLHDKSVDIGVHLISLIRAYERAKDVVQLGNYNRKRNITVQPRHILDEGVYSMSEDGSIGNMFSEDANKNDRAFKRGRAWLFEESETRQDANELLHCYEILGIDIRDEDPRIYDKSYVDKLVVAYVTSNIDYVMRKNDAEKQKIYSSFGFMRNIDKQLKDLPLESYAEYANVQQMSDEDTAYTAMRIYIDSPNFPDDERYRMEYVNTEEQASIYNACKLFIAYYNYLTHTSIDLDKYHCCDGFFYDKREMPLVLDMTGYIQDPIYSSYALLNINGYLVTCAVDIRTQCVDIFDMCQHIENYIHQIEEAPMRWDILSL